MSILSELVAASGANRAQEQGIVLLEQLTEAFPILRPLLNLGAHRITKANRPGLTFLFVGHCPGSMELSLRATTRRLSTLGAALDDGCLKKKLNPSHL